jgi:hypothetical protein
MLHGQQSLMASAQRWRGDPAKWFCRQSSANFHPQISDTVPM